MAHGIMKVGTRARPQAGAHLRPGAGSLGRLYAGRHRPILVHLSPEVAERMPLFLADWPYEAAGEPADAPAITVAATAAGYRLTKANGESDDISHVLDTANRVVGALIEAFVAQACQWRSKKGPPRRCKKGPLGGCGLVPVVHGRAPRATRRALNRLTRRRAREGPVGPRGQAWAGWSVQLAVGV